MQIVWFVIGGTFFLCWPISSHYPKYRYLVSPFKWALWDIPTNAEWSFAYLRCQAQITRKRIIERKIEQCQSRELANLAMDEGSGRTATVSNITVDDLGSEDKENGIDDSDNCYSWCSAISVAEGFDVRSFRCQFKTDFGQLVIYSEGIRFVRNLPKKELWRRKYLDLAEMRKLQGLKMSKLAPFSSNQLQINCIDGSVLQLGRMKNRDEAFNTVIAFSGMQWQSLQIVNSDDAQPL